MLSIISINNNNNIINKFKTRLEGNNYLKNYKINTIKVFSNYNINNLKFRNYFLAIFKNYVQMKVIRMKKIFEKSIYILIQ